MTNPSSQRIAPDALQHLLGEQSVLALLDVREHGEYNAAHIPGSSSLPRRLIEFNLARLVPWTSVQIVFCDDDEQRAVLAARTAARMGYTHVSVLEGGVNRWAGLGLPTEWGMNVPSKAFGEMIEVSQEVPSIDPLDLNLRIRRGEDLLILDSRTPEEYQRFCIPGARSVPGGELALRITDLVKERPGATVVVNCAGRTRSIIGTRVLQRMGLPKVAALKNGTAGWLLAGLELEQGATRLDLPEPSTEGRATAEAFAVRAATDDGVSFLALDALRSLPNRAGSEPVYLIDVRTADEYAGGHIPGFWWFPGGQAVQRADDAVAVRGATVVFCCDGVARAAVTASWYRQMGFGKVFIVEGGTRAWMASALPLERGMGEQSPFGLADAQETVRTMATGDLQVALRGERRLTLLFVDPSSDFAAGHVPGTRWLPRGWLELRVAAMAPDRSALVVLIDRAGPNAVLAAATLRELGYQNVRALAGGMEAWRRAGLPVEQGLSGVMRPPDDVVPAGPDRSPAETIEYLRWEEALGESFRGQ